MRELLGRLTLALMLGMGGSQALAAPQNVELRTGDRGYLRVAAIGMPPLGGTSSRDAARQNALDTAQRRLLTVLLDMPIAVGKPKVRERLESKPQGRERLKTLMARARVAGQDLADGSVEITLEVPYAGPGGLAEFLASLN